MATICRDVIRRALRKIRVVAAGDAPGSDDANDAMETLQSIFMELAGMGVFGEMIDTIVTTPTYTAHEQERLLCKVEDGVQVTLPDTHNPICPWLWPPDYDWWLEGAGLCCGSRPPRDGACIQITDLYSSLNQTWVYNALSSRWVLLNDLNLDAGTPFGERYAEAIICRLACRLAPEYGQTPDQETAATSVRGVYAMTHRYDSTRKPLRVEYM